jgi:type III pantothenate kinase
MSAAKLTAKSTAAASTDRRLPLVAVDIGNTRTKLGLFTTLGAGIPEPDRTLALGPDWRPAQLEAWLAGPADLVRWRIASVNRSGEARLLQWLVTRAADRFEVLSVDDYPLAVEVDEPDKVGMDRLAGALGANALKQPDRAAIVIDLGSAITVDLVSPAGAFLGGAILPGIAMSAKALHEFTDLLPLEPMIELAEPPAALGKTTSACLRAGLYWGAIGAVRELVSRLTPPGDQPQLYLTGGAGAAAAGLIVDSTGRPADLVPHLTLAGIALMSGSRAGA